MRFRFRFTTRRLMALVALAAVTTAGGLWARELARSSRDYQVIADQRERTRARFARGAKISRDPASRRAFESMAAWYASSRDTFAAAARRPWVAVPDDEPPDLKTLRK